MKGYLKQDGIPMPYKPIKIEAIIPMFVDGELETFDNNIHSIIEEYSKMQLHEKDQILTQRIIMKQEEEIENLKSIISSVKEDFLNANSEAIELKSRIHKAIEYIKTHTYDDSIDGDGTRLMFEKANGYNLLNILQGVSNENKNKQ